MRLGISIRHRCRVAGGVNRGGLGVIEDDGDAEGVKVLHRMITYVRDEAVRLQIMDVAVLLEHAEDAVLAFAPSALADPTGGGSTTDETQSKH